MWRKAIQSPSAWQPEDLGPELAPAEVDSSIFNCAAVLIRAWIANLRYVGTSAMRRRSDYWAILKGNPLHGARSRRGQPTVILAARTGLANYPNKYGRWPASSFVETCVDRD